MQKAPQLMGERSSSGKLLLKKMFAIITADEKMKLTAQAAADVLFQ